MKYERLNSGNRIYTYMAVESNINNIFKLKSEIYLGQFNCKFKY